MAKAGKYYPNRLDPKYTVSIKLGHIERNIPNEYNKDSK
jgi:hypothetical protein